MLHAKIIGTLLNPCEMGFKHMYETYKRSLTNISSDAIKLTLVERMEFTNFDLLYFINNSVPIGAFDQHTIK